MKLKVNQGVILIFLCESFKKKRRKPQEKQRNKKQFIVNVFFAPEKRKISKNYSFFLNTRILCMNFLQTIFLQNGFSSIKICLQNIHFRALMCVIVSISRISVVKWHISLANAFQPHISNKKLIITKSVEKQVKKVFLKILQISQENNSVGVSF